MSRIAFASAKPRVTDWHATTNRLPRFENAFFAHEEQRGLAVFLESGDVRAIEINFGIAPRGLDFDQRQAALVG